MCIHIYIYIYTSMYLSIYLSIYMGGPQESFFLLAVSFFTRIVAVVLSSGQTCTRTRRSLPGERERERERPGSPGKTSAAAFGSSFRRLFVEAQCPLCLAMLLDCLTAFAAKFCLGHGARLAHILAHVYTVAQCPQCLAMLLDCLTAFAAKFCLGHGAWLAHILAHVCACQGMQSPVLQPLMLRP